MIEPSDLQFARFVAANGDGKRLRETSGLTRPEFVRNAGGTFTVHALRAWEAGLRRPRGPKGEAYGKAVRHLLNQVNTLRAMASPDQSGAV
ncbi:MAG: hypothetical protein ABSC31_01835 [Acidimicrobiales bacterium]|jgi:hypothetical protein